MPDINPLTNNQIFLKKIAENTGSDYETGDVSEINPLTIDQILLKEIAANTAGQSGDITELEGKVADNTSAIGAIVNVNGCCNILPYTIQSTATATVIFTVNNNGSVTVNGTPTSSYPYITYHTSFTLKVGTYVLDSGVAAQSSVYISLTDSGGNSIANTYGGKTEFTLASDTVVVAYIYLHDMESVTNFTIYPMLYDARLKPTGYVPYAMTNRELTERVEKSTYELVGDYNFDSGSGLSGKWHFYRNELTRTCRVIIAGAKIDTDPGVAPIHFGTIPSDYKPPYVAVAPITVIYNDVNNGVEGYISVSNVNGWLVFHKKGAVDINSDLFVTIEWFY